MLDNRKKKVVYKAIAFTFGILFFGLLFANVIYDWQKSDLDKALIEINNESKDTELFLNYYNVFEDKNSCEMLNSELEGFSSRVYEIGRLTSQYTEDNKNVNELKEIQRQHVYYKLELWLKLIKFDKVCNDKKNYILYFYPYNCTECAPMATEIMDLAHNDKDTWVFSMPAEIDIKMLKVIEEHYNIKSLPAVVVNGHTLQGVDSYTKIKDYLYDFNNVVEN